MGHGRGMPEANTSLESQLQLRFNHGSEVNWLLTPKHSIPGGRKKMLIERSRCASYGSTVLAAVITSPSFLRRAITYPVGIPLRVDENKNKIFRSRPLRFAT